MASEQFVRYTDADSCREADFLIQFHVYVPKSGRLSTISQCGLRLSTPWR